MKLSPLELTVVIPRERKYMIVKTSAPNLFPHCDSLLEIHFTACLSQQKFLLLVAYPPLTILLMLWLWLPWTPNDDFKHTLTFCWLVCRLPIWGPFLKRLGPGSFRTRKAVAKSQTFWLQSCFVHAFLKWRDVFFTQWVSGVYTFLLLDTDWLKIALPRARKVSGPFEKQAPGLGCSKLD